MPPTTVSLPTFTQYSECKACSLHEPVKSVGVSARWAEWTLPPSPDTPALLVVGQNPGQKEDEANRNFIGPTGRMLRYTYIGDTVDNPSSSLHGRQVGPGLNKRCTVYLDNVARCGTWGTMGEPTKAQYTTCAPKLLDTIRSIATVHARVLLLLTGAPAIWHTYHTLTGKGISSANAFDRSGHVLELPNLPPLQLFSTYHPAYIIRKNAIIEAVIDHLHLVSDALDGTLAVPSKPTMLAATAPTKELLALCRRAPTTP